jgi:uncharacterized linocin/CFP29 family protein
MNGSLGRDRVWNDHIWSEIDKAVREEVGRARVAQKVFPSTVMNNVLAVSTNRLVPPGKARPAPGDDAFRPFFEISSEFVLTQAQVDGEENLRLAPSRARMAASAIASAEDTILFLGKNSIPPLIAPAGVNVTNQPTIPPGFVEEAANYPPFTKVEDAGPRVLGNILKAVADGMAALYGRAQPGPYALFLSPVRYAQTFGPAGKGELRTPGDEIKEIVTGGFYMVNSLADVGKAFPETSESPDKTSSPPTPSPPNSDIGILVSLGGEPVKIILGTEAMTAFTSADALGNYRFRVYERIQMVVQDGRSFQGLTFGKVA